MFGGAVRYPVEDVTPTFLTNGVLSTLRQADHVATTTLQEAGISGNISQMPVILLPLHFDRDPSAHLPSCQRSIAIRTFITNDFMTGIPAQPGKEIPEEVIIMINNDHIGRGTGNNGVGWLLNVPATCEYLRDGSAQTILRAATLRWKLQIKLSTSPSHCILTPGRQSKC